MVLFTEILDAEPDLITADPEQGGDVFDTEKMQQFQPAPGKRHFTVRAGCWATYCAACSPPPPLNSAVGWQDQTSERSIQLLCEAFEVSAVQCIPPQRDPSVEGSTSSWVHAAKAARALPMTLPGRFHNILFHNICVIFGPPHRS